MITEICLYLRNFFEMNQPMYAGIFTIADGQLNIVEDIATGQYYRIRGSVFNDGVHQRGSETLTSEEFEGTVQLMAVPADFLDLVGDIEAWVDAYGGATAASNSPFQSENFAGVYSYSKGATDGKNGAAGPTWQSIFGARLRRYQKI